MDRVIVYPGQIPLDTDILSSARNAMIAVGYLAQATLGTTVVADGLACLPTLPASMQVNVGPGSITQMATVDASAYGTLLADLDPLVKQGINYAGSTAFTISAPGVSGQSIAYLIEGQLIEADGSPISLPYYNASLPSQPFTGPNNSQAQQNTVRTQRVGLQLKAGSPAATGTQATPGVDAGWVGLYVVTVNFAQTSITASSIVVHPNAPFIRAKIPALAPLFSPTFTGVPAAPTPAVNDSSTRLATTAFVTAVGGIGNSQIFSASGSFTVPASVTRIKVTLWAAGGGSGGAYNGGNSGGGGGGGCAIGVYNVTPGAVIAVTIGAGGTAGAATTSPTAGGVGGPSIFAGLCQATGGTGGGASNGTGVASAGGGGGTAQFGTILNVRGGDSGGGLIGVGAGGGNGGGSYQIPGIPAGGFGGQGLAGRFPGGGAGGTGAPATGSNFPGNLGAAGYCIVEW